MIEETKDKEEDFGWKEADDGGGVAELPPRPGLPLRSH